MPVARPVALLLGLGALLASPRLNDVNVRINLDKIRLDLYKTNSELDYRCIYMFHAST